MARTLIGELGGHVGETVTVEGWVDVRRDQGKMVFFDFRDRSGLVQGVVLPGSPALETATGVRNAFVVILSEAQTLPFEKDTDVNLDTLLDYRPFTLRSARARAIFKVQAEIVNAYRTFLINEGFTEFEAPKLIGDDAEGSGEVFAVPYFYDKTAHLATSPQLYKQIMVGVFERVFSIGNVFRAEKHSTTRHTNEYTSLDAEFGFIKDHKDIIMLESRFMRFLINQLKTQ